MFRTNCVIRCISNIEPHIKSIHEHGINSRNVIFNPRLIIFNIAYLSCTRLLSESKSHQILILELQELALMEHCAHSLDSRQVESLKIQE